MRSLYSIGVLKIFSRVNLKTISMNDPAAEQRGIRCHAGPDKPAPAFGKPGASSPDFWIPAPRLCGDKLRRNGESPQAAGNETLIDKTKFVDSLRLSLHVSGNIERSSKG